ncbi:unnamed protein product [Clonostachys rosea f. rosea IK726]|uniref:Uncharacterized protein n=1 Tax=Clonostachys rosea f. rosea IK726 TaxID=1349383 RepID=A0ACA9UIS7_BIOOC|nr:unnamed protein product [Clonostachys rosea f. rosea IK726]
MASDAKFTDQNAPVTNTKTRASSDEEHARGSNDESSVIDAQTYAYSEDRKIGVTGAVFDPQQDDWNWNVFAATGSVGVAFILWLVGGILTFCGLSVFLEFGLAIPRSGGPSTRNLRPRLQMILLGFSSGNALAFGRYILYASGWSSVDGWPARGIAIVCVTFAVALHATLPKWGVRLFNILGVFKVGVVLFIIFAGFGRSRRSPTCPRPPQLRQLLRHRGRRRLRRRRCLRLLQRPAHIIYSYKGWENANYVVSELKNPRKTLAIAAPLASDLAKSEVLVAALFFKNVFGDSAAARSLPVFVCLSNLGNVLAVSFAHARLNQELAKEGMLPWSRFWASNKPFNAPAASLFIHWLVTVIILVAPPAGPAYSFIVNLYTYPGAWINAFVGAGLVYLQWNKSENWSSPWHTYLPISILWFLSNVFLVIVPFIPPVGDWNADGYPYYIFPVVGVLVLILGGVYWIFWTIILPRIGGYQVVAERTFDEDGVEVVRYRKVKLA